MKLSLDLDDRQRCMLMESLYEQEARYVRVGHQQFAMEIRALIENLIKIISTARECGK